MGKRACGLRGAGNKEWKYHDLERNRWRIFWGQINKSDSEIQASRIASGLHWIVSPQEALYRYRRGQTEREGVVTLISTDRSRIQGNLQEQFEKYKMKNIIEISTSPDASN